MQYNKEEKNHKTPLRCLWKKCFHWNQTCLSLEQNTQDKMFKWTDHLAELCLLLLLLLLLLAWLVLLLGSACSKYFGSSGKALDPRRETAKKDWR
mmetsp:Transcript_89344/g.149162  ORF Transcript_89344/g.149162 Transcript_89344/m.149162 type:complete len:95 (+) Transcript_89344:291-575(+)